MEVETEKTAVRYVEEFCYEKEQRNGQVVEGEHREGIL
jgi:hypothetical protein